MKKTKRSHKKHKDNRYKFRRPKSRSFQNKKSRTSQHREQPLILDSFSHNNVVDWATTDRLLGQLHQNVYAVLDAQRWYIYDELCSAIAGVTTGPFEFTKWSRCIDYRFGDEPLSCRGYHYGVGGRFNYGRRIDQRRFRPFPALYLAEDVATARNEYFQIKNTEGAALSAQDFALMPNRGGLVEFPLSGKLSRVLNLEHFRVLDPFLKLIKQFDFSEELRKQAEALGHKDLRPITTRSDLRKSILESNWRGMPTNFGLPANPQIFGKIVKDAGVEGILYPSIHGPGACLAVFVENLSEESFVRIECDVPSSVTTTVLNKNTWESLTMKVDKKSAV